MSRIIAAIRATLRFDAPLRRHIVRHEREIGAGAIAELGRHADAVEAADDAIAGAGRAACGTRPGRPRRRSPRPCAAARPATQRPPIAHLRALVGRRVEVVGRAAVAVDGADERVVFGGDMAAERNQRFDAATTRLAASAAVTFSVRRENSSLVRPMSNACTSNAPPRLITVSKIAVSSCESMRCPSAATTADESRRRCAHAAADYATREECEATIRWPWRRRQRAGVAPGGDSRCETMCGCSARCSARRWSARKGRRSTSASSGCGRARNARGPVRCRRGCGLSRADRGAGVHADGRRVPVARAFAQFLHLANIAEQHDRIRRRRVRQRDPDAGPPAGSIEETLPRLAAVGRRTGCMPPILALRIELVLTAHPTEIMRRTLQRKYTAIAQALAGLDRARRDAVRAARRSVGDAAPRDHRRVGDRGGAPASGRRPLDEVRSAFGVFEHTIWDAVPEYLRSLDRTMRDGDRAGAAARGRADPVRIVDRRRSRRQSGDHAGGHAAGLPRRAVGRVDALRAGRRRASRGPVDDRRERGAPAGLQPGGAAEPYRALLRNVHRGIETTRRAIQDQLSTRPGGRGGPRPPKRSIAPRRISRGRCVCASTRCTTPATASSPTDRWPTCCGGWPASGYARAASTSGRRPGAHTDAIDLIARHAGRPGYTDWPEDARVAFLIAELEALSRMPSRARRETCPTTRAPPRCCRPSGCSPTIAPRLAGRLRDHDGRPALRRPGGRAAAAARRGRSAASRRAALRNGAGPARRRAPSIDRLLSIPWYRDRVATPAIARK